MDFSDLRGPNVRRAQRWHQGFPNGDDGWTIADWSNAMCGEAGEAANIVKKIRRFETGISGLDEVTRETLEQWLAAELADVIIYADLLAAYCGIDLSEAIREKFNRVSVRYGWPERL